MKTILRAFLCVLLLCLASAAAQATTITVQSTTVPNWTKTTTAPRLRVYYDKTFTTSAGTIVASGSPTSGVAYKSVTCTLLAGTVTIPSFTIDSTRDGIDSRNARVSFYWFSSSGANLGAFDPYVNLQIPESLTSTSGCSPSGTCATFSDLKTYNTGAPALPTESYYTMRQVDLRLVAITGAPVSAPFITTTADSTLTGETNLGALTSGLLKITVSAGTAVPATATAETDYVTPTGAGTLANKTLTSPTVNGGALSGTFTGAPTLSGNPIFSGAPSFTGVPTHGTGTITDDTAWSSTGDNVNLLSGAISTTSVDPSMTFQRTQTGGGSAGTGRKRKA